MTKSDDKKYKYTRQLLKIAKQEGDYTNKEIEKKAGLSGSSSSLASRWLNGHALATERQMRYFKNNYGHLLKRKMEHLFYRHAPDGDDLSTKFIKLTGDIIFKHHVRLDPSYEYKKGINVLRVVVLESNRLYKLVVQYRAGFVQWRKVQKGYSPLIETNSKGLVSSDNEESNWYLWEVIDCNNTDELIQEFEVLLGHLLVQSNIVDWARNSGRLDQDTPSHFFNHKHISPMRFSFYQKLMKLGLQSELLPF
ncbi:TPA: hypothetical protein NG589_003428 [Vibrio parahaemolyticus]|nr:hypothetical protein [Vibrio parahaemolyticus]